MDEHVSGPIRTLFLSLTVLFPVNIIKVLGEGGFSFVYLAQDDHSGVSRM
jgi:serine/threonine protein kinase